MTDRRSWKVLGRLIRWNVTLLFFPDFSPATTIRRKAFNPVLKKMTSLGLQPFLIYPAVIKLWHKGEQKSFGSPQKAEDFISSLSQQKTYAAASTGRQRKMAGMEAVLAAQEQMMAGWTWMLEPAFCFFLLSSLLLDIVPIYPVQRSLCCKD